MGVIRTGFSVGAEMSLSTTATSAELHEDKDTDPNSEDVRAVCELGWLHGEINTMASSPTSITWWLCADSGGDIPLTDKVTETIVVGETTATDGGVATVLDLPYHITKNHTLGSLWVFAETDTGTCKMISRLYWTKSG